MAHDVFISYASADQTVAQMVCATLEKQGIRCWMAPRDVQPGDDWGSAIVAAIKASRAMVLVFSGAANDSRHIPREVERAIGREIPLVPVRIENVEPSGSLEYSLSSVHWLDAISPPVEAHIVKLAERLRTMIDRPGPGQPTPPVPAPVPETSEPLVAAPIPALPITPASKAGTPSRSWQGLLLAAAGIAGIIVLAIVLSNQRSAPVAPSSGSSPSPTASSTAAPTSTPTPDADPIRTPTPRPAVPTSVPPPPPGPAAGTLWVDRNVNWYPFPAHTPDPKPDPVRFDELGREVRAYPRDYRPLAELGAIFFDAGRHDVAINYYLDALALTPGNSNVRIDLAIAYLYVKNRTEAVSHLSRVLKAEPRHALALLNLGVAHASSGNLRAAADCWQDIIKYHPSSWQSFEARELMAKIRVR
jgi:hypothetical protein